MINCISYNTQRKTGLESLLQQDKLAGVDLIFLQRCRPQLYKELNKSKDHNVFWTPATKGNDTSAGFCIMSKQPITNVEVVDTNVKTNHEDTNQSCKYIRFEYNGLKLINFLPPFPPGGPSNPDIIDIMEQRNYMRHLSAQDFDMAVGDCHWDYHNLNHTPKFLSDYKVINTLPNFADADMRQLMLTWVIAKHTVEITNEAVLEPFENPMCHHPVKFTVTHK